MTATKLDDILAYKRGTPKHFFDFDLQKVGDNFHRFGEIAIATKTKKLKGKLEDRGDTIYFVGYADNHAADVFRMVNIRTNKVSKTRDITFTGKMYGEIFDADNYKLFKDPKGPPGETFLKCLFWRIPKLT